MLTIILAAGKGKRMMSKLPKVLHTLAGKPMLGWILDTCSKFFDSTEKNRVIIVLHPEMVDVLSYIKNWKENEHNLEISAVFQTEQLGSGHAALMAREYVACCEEGDSVLLLSGDVPLIGVKTLKALSEAQKGVSAAVLTVYSQNPQGYGRVLMNSNGEVERIIEDKDLQPLQKEIGLINAGVYALDAHALNTAFDFLDNNNAQKEYYLPQIIEILAAQGKHICSVQVEDALEVQGVNDRLQLVQLEKELRKRIARHWLQQGVTIRDIDNTFIDADVKIGLDTVVEPYSFISGKTKIGENCQIGPFTQMEDCEVANRCKIERSHLKQVKVHNNVQIGPFARLREGTVLEEETRIGDFVELKKTRMGRGAKAQHLSYLGDSDIGEEVNIGAGTITCNYDGFNKHETIIEKRAFIGSNTSLVAPVHIGAGAIVGAGSVIVEDVEADALALGRGIQIQKPGRALQIREKNRKKKKEGEFNAL